jgi:hypothetical protein
MSRRSWSFWQRGSNGLKKKVVLPITLSKDQQKWED